MVCPNRCESFDVILNDWSSLIRWRSLVDLEGSQNKKSRKPIVVATNGCFDILHAGHISMLQEASNEGDFLVIGLNGDQSVRNLKGAGRPIHNQTDRKSVLEAVKYVNHVHIFNENDCSRFLIASKPNVYVKAGDYTLETLNPNEYAVLKELGTKIIFVKYLNDLSTSKAVRKLNV